MLLNYCAKFGWALILLYFAVVGEYRYSLRFVVKVGIGLNIGKNNGVSVEMERLVASLRKATQVLLK